MAEANNACGGVGLCVLPAEHKGICVYKSHPPGAPPATIPAGTAQIGHNERGEVVVDFGETGPWQWVCFTPEEAITFGETMIRRARALQGDGGYINGKG